MTSRRTAARHTIATVVGARPQFIKAAPVSRALAATGRIEEVLIHTGQHHDDMLSDVFFRELEMELPRHNLGISGGNHGAMTGQMLAGLESLFLKRRPDAVLVYGDTNSTLAGALAASKLGIPVLHVEAGLRSYNRRMPEEINRVLTDHLSAVLFCPTDASVRNLEKENITSNVVRTGDVMYDVAIAMGRKARETSTILAELGLKPHAYYVATLHRAENVDDPKQLQALFAYLKEEAARRPLIMPLHPRTRQALERAGLDPAPIRVLPPLGYLDMTRLIMDADAVFTDSGGLQKEAYFHRTPCVTLRTETEWVETVASGWNRLWTEAYLTSRREITDYGDGTAAQTIAGSVEEFVAR